MLLALSLWFILRCEAKLMDSEKSIMKALIQHFHVRHCILTDGVASLEDIKTFSEWQVPVNKKTAEQIVHYLNSNYRPPTALHIGCNSPEWHVSTQLPSPKTMILLKASNVDVMESLLSKVNANQGAFIWIGILENSTYQDYALDLSVPYNTEFLIVQPENSSDFRLIEVYQIKNVSHQFNFGTWNNESGLKVTNISFMYHRRPHFNNTQLWETRPIKEGEHMYLFELWQELGKLLNFRSNQTRQFSKMDAMLDYPAFHAFYYRSDCIRPILKVKFSMFIQKPGIKVHDNYFAKTFSFNLWIALLTWVLTATLSIIFIHICSQKKTADLYIVDSGFTVFESFCNQAGSKTLANLPFRAAVTATRTLAVFIVPAFSATLLSQLAVRAPEAPFEDLEGFLREGTYKLGAKKGDNFLFVQGSGSAAAEPISEKYLTASQPNNSIDGLEKMCNEKYVFLGYHNSLRKMKPPCDIFQIRHPVFTSYTSIPLQQRSPFKEVFNYKLLNFYSSGIIQKMQDTEDQSQFSIDKRKMYAPVEFSQFTQLMVIVLVGMALSVVVLISEFIFKRLW